MSLSKQAPIEPAPYTSSFCTASQRHSPGCKSGRAPPAAADPIPAAAADSPAPAVAPAAAPGGIPAESARAARPPAAA